MGEWTELRGFAWLVCCLNLLTILTYILCLILHLGQLCPFGVFDHLTLFIFSKRAKTNNLKTPKHRDSTHPRNLISIFSP